MNFEVQTLAFPITPKESTKYAFKSFSSFEDSKLETLCSTDQDCSTDIQIIKRKIRDQIEGLHQRKANKLKFQQVAKIKKQQAVIYELLLNQQNQESLNAYKIHQLKRNPVKKSNEDVFQRISLRNRRN